MDSEVFTFMCGTRLVHGRGSSSMTGEICKEIGIKKALVVAGPSVTRAGLAEPILRSLSASNIGHEVFSDLGEDAEVQQVQAGATVARQSKVDGVVVIGGGSSICAGRGMALVATNGGSIRDYEGTEQYKSSPIPVVVVSTTAGSGTEVSAGMVIYDVERKRVFVCRGSEIYARVAILDPEMLVTAPPRVRIAAGLDALTHAVESVCTNMRTPLTDALAYQAFKMIMNSFRKAIFTNDRAALSEMHLGSIIANIACGNAKLGLVHGMSMVYGISLPHGLKDGILLPYVMQYNFPVAKSQFCELAMLAGVRKETCRSEDELAEEVIARIRLLYSDCEVPSHFTSEQVDPGSIPDLVQQSMSTPYVRYNIRRPSPQDVEKLWREVVV